MNSVSLVYCSSLLFVIDFLYYKRKVLVTNYNLRAIYSYKYQLSIMYVFVINTSVLTPRCQRLETRQIFN